MGENKIIITQGDYRTVNLTVQSNGSAQDITGATLWLTVKDDLTKEDADAIMQVTGSIVDGTAGTAKFEINSNHSNKEAGDYTYDIQIKLTDGSIYTLIKDDFQIIQDVTKTT